MRVVYIPYIYMHIHAHTYAYTCTYMAMIRIVPVYDKNGPPTPTTNALGSAGDCCDCGGPRGGDLCCVCPE